MNQPEIVINVRGGVIQEVYSSGELADLVIVDWDVEDSSGQGDSVVVPRQGRELHLAVSHPIIYPLWRLAGTEVEAAIEASELAQLLGHMLSRGGAKPSKQIRTRRSHRAARHPTTPAPPDGSACEWQPSASPR